MRPILAVLFALLMVPIAAAGAPPTADAARQQATEAQLAALQQRIAALAQAQQQTAAQRDALAGRIAQAALALAAAAAQRQQADAALAAGTQRAAQLAQALAQQQARVQQQRDALAALLRASYALDRGADLRVALGDPDLARQARALTDANYLAQQRLARVQALQQALAELAAQQAAQRAQQGQLAAAQAAAAASEQAQLQARAQLLALRKQAAARARSEAQQMAQLQRQQQDLQQLLARLRDLFADIPAQLPGNTPFAQLKGRLPWPLAGRARPWQDGLLISPDAGSAVRAVANGRVAYADWLRGFGMLVVVDQGEGWISLYGNNESLRVRVGDWVSPGQVIAEAGHAAAGFPGAWFALRHDGRPVDPRAWLQAAP